MTDETTTTPETPAVDAAAAPADPIADAPAVAGVPTYDEAQAMFADNSGLAWVLTDRGNLSREGVLQPAAIGA